MASSENSDPSPCATCGKKSTKACTGCLRVVYCNQDCQRADWKQHKKLCFPEGAKCTRCLQVIDDTNINKCTVPHPVHLLDHTGSSFGGGSGATWNFSCRGCNKDFTKQGQNYDERDTAPIVSGTKFCFSGSHTIKPLDDADHRRVYDDALVLQLGPNIQQQIDAIPTTMPNVRILTIESSGMFDESIRPKLNIAMPKLENLRLIDVAFQEVTLNTGLTPKIETLFMQNIPDDCRLTVLLPELKDFSMYYYGPPDDDSWLQKMLATSKKLVKFDSYKLRVGPKLSFAGNDLESINLHRAELLESLVVYAPKLRWLKLQACYNMDGSFKVLETHPHFERVVPQSRFEVNTRNATVSPAIARTLKSHPRIEWEDDEAESQWAGGGVIPMLF